jgi:hypothetical protein
MMNGIRIINKFSGVIYENKDCRYINYLNDCLAYL